MQCIAIIAQSGAILSFVSQKRIGTRKRGRHWHLSPRNGHPHPQTGAQMPFSIPGWDFEPEMLFQYSQRDLYIPFIQIDITLRPHALMRPKVAITLIGKHLYITP